MHETYMNTQDNNVIFTRPTLESLMLLFVSGYFMYNWNSHI